MGSGQVKYLEWEVRIFVKLKLPPTQCISNSPLMNDELNSFLPQIPPSLHSETVMQDVHGILGGGSASGGLVGGGGRIFGDRRMRAAPHHHQQALNCPRCDSLNTKFCYYNNYNLSQPRHFCKNCRRYWTKGGVLRNVPVGGGCRKSKRSSKRKQSENSSQEPLSSSAAKDRHVSNSGSSSESTSAKAAGGEAIGVVSELSSSPVFPFSDQAPGKVAVTFNSLASAPMPVFTEARGFVSLMEGDQHQSLFGYGNMEMEPETETTPFGMQQQNQVNNNNNNQLLLQNLSSRDWQKEKMDGVDNWGQGIFDQTVQVDLLSNRRTGDGVLAGGDWHGVSGGGGGGGHLGMFDLTPGSDWSQSSQWHESDHHLYLPP